MCNLHEQRVPYQAYVEAMRGEGLGLRADQGEHDLPEREKVQIGDIGAVARLAGAAVELVPMRFGWPPARPKAGPVFNFRSEGRRFGGSRRCLIPSSAFFEFTGKTYPKAKHRFTLAAGPLFMIAGLWQPGAGNQPDAYTMLTTAPGPDVAPYHSRQIVILPPGLWGAWLHLSRPEGELLRPLPAGSLAVETVRPAAR